jgi:hypothetical protein
MSLRIDSVCELSVGTVVQLPNPNAIYSRDEGKERSWLPPLVVGIRVRPTCCLGKVSDHCRGKARERREGSDSASSLVM